MIELKFKTHYSAQVPSKGITFTEPSRTKQSMRDECNINLILKRYNATGIITHVSEKQPIFADVSNFQDYQKCLDYVNRASDAFDALPSELKSKLDYNPQNLLPFIQDKANYDECVRLGIFNKPEKVVDPNLVNVPSPGSGTEPAPSN